jgi:hypothetical protein
MPRGTVSAREYGTALRGRAVRLRDMYMGTSRRVQRCFLATYRQPTGLRDEVSHAAVL